MNIKPPPQIEKDWLEYHKLKNSGLKKQANIILISIVDKLSKIPKEDKKDFLLNVCEAGLGNDIDNRIQFPLFKDSILPILIEGLKNLSVKEIILIVKSSQRGFFQEIYKEIGDIDNLKLLNSALEIEPNNLTVINSIAHEYIEKLYWGSHHLPSTLIIEDDFAKELVNSSNLFFLKHKSEINTDLINNHNYYIMLYCDYLSWKNEKLDIDFEEWCRKNEKQYSWVKSYYYKK